MLDDSLSSACQQVSDHLRVFAQPAGIWVAPVVGGMSPAKQRRLLAKRPAVVVATPGRLWELVREGELLVSSLVVKAECSQTISVCSCCSQCEQALCLACVS